MPYVIKKNIVSNAAISLREPNRIVINAINEVKRIAVTGSPFSLTLAKERESGTIEWLPNANKTRGEPTNILKADEIVAPMIPAITNQLQRE